MGTVPGAAGGVGAAAALSSIVVPVIVIFGRRPIALAAPTL
jgi:hypothetical protein